MPPSSPITKTKFIVDLTQGIKDKPSSAGVKTIQKISEELLASVESQASTNTSAMTVVFTKAVAVVVAIPTAVDVCVQTNVDTLIAGVKSTACADPALVSCTVTAKVDGCSGRRLESGRRLSTQDVTFNVARTFPTAEVQGDGTVVSTSAASSTPTVEVALDTVSITNQVLKGVGTVSGASGATLSAEPTITALKAELESDVVLKTSTTDATDTIASDLGLSSSALIATTIAQNYPPAAPPSPPTMKVMCATVKFKFDRSKLKKCTAVKCGRAMKKQLRAAERKKQKAEFRKERRTYCRKAERIAKRAMAAGR